MPDLPSPPARFLTLAQVAELLAIDVDEVMALVAEGRLRAAHLGTGTHLRVEQASVEDYVDDQVEETRRMLLWQQSNVASFPELWGAREVRHRD